MSASERRAEIDGVLIADKPAGPTSHDLVAEARRLFRRRQVGHAGTLDPFATGVLILLFGRACKLSSYLAAADKTYLACVSIGRSTDTLDATGAVTEERAVCVGGADLEAALDRERARELQVPPALSAISVQGERAHRAARRGRTPELLPRSVRVEELRLISRSGSTVELELTVSKGYYVRALARDLGETLGVPAHLSALRRLASGAFTIAEACAWPPGPGTELMSLEAAARRSLPWASLTEDGVTRALHGKILDGASFVEAPAGSGVSAWLDPSGKLVALGKPDGGAWRVVRGIRSRS